MARSVFRVLKTSALPVMHLSAVWTKPSRKYITAPGDTQAVRLQKKMRLASLLLDVDADAPREQRADEEADPAREAATEHAS
mgnify:CR=1 FL=1